MTRDEMKEGRWLRLVTSLVMLGNCAAIIGWVWSFYTDRWWIAVVISAIIMGLILANVVHASGDFSRRTK